MEKVPRPEASRRPYEPEDSCADAPLFASAFVTMLIAPEKAEVP